MGYFTIDEFENLRRRYANPTTPEDKVVKMKLDEISKYYTECSPEESVFADEIIRAFCGIIDRLNMAHMLECHTLNQVIENIQADTVSYIGISNDIPYQSGEALIADFKEYFKNTSHTESTINDYLARIKTFTNRYLNTIPRVWEMYRREAGERKVDDVLFTYRNLELIIASFDTKNDAGETDKQKNNIRSALKKLNQFKRSREG